jgi:hypothetical protein
MRSCLMAVWRGYWLFASGAGVAEARQAGCLRWDFCDGMSLYIYVLFVSVAGSSDAEGRCGDDEDQCGGADDDAGQVEACVDLGQGQEGLGAGYEYAVLEEPFSEGGEGGADGDDSKGQCCCAEEKQEEVVVFVVVVHRIFLRGLGAGR